MCRQANFPSWTGGVVDQSPKSIGALREHLFFNRYVKGTTVIDIMDARTNRLIWRAIETDTGSNVLDVQSAKKVDKMAADAFKHFPPKV
jgi:uncharacterized protein DUF4136